MRRAKKSNVLIDVIERAAEYKSRQVPSSDSDQDDDNDSTGSADQWEYPTVKNSTIMAHNQPSRTSLNGISNGKHVVSPPSTSTVQVNGHKLNNNYHRNDARNEDTNFRNDDANFHRNDYDDEDEDDYDYSPNGTIVNNGRNKQVQQVAQQLKQSNLRYVIIVVVVMLCMLILSILSIFYSNKDFLKLTITMLFLSFWSKRKILKVLIKF